MERFNGWMKEDYVFLYFHLMDVDSDGLLSRNDLFQCYKSNRVQRLEEDIIDLIRMYDRGINTQECSLKMLYMQRNITYENFLIATRR
jgi:Ca2+-binding EF-hand superfamily protein